MTQFVTSQAFANGVFDEDAEFARLKGEVSAIEAELAPGAITATVSDALVPFVAYMQAELAVLGKKSPSPIMNRSTEFDGYDLNALMEEGQ